MGLAKLSFIGHEKLAPQRRQGFTLVKWLTDLATLLLAAQIAQDKVRFDESAIFRQCLDPCIRLWHRMTFTDQQPGADPAKFQSAGDAQQVAPLVEKPGSLQFSLEQTFDLIQHGNSDNSI